MKEKTCLVYTISGKGMPIKVSASLRKLPGLYRRKFKKMMKIIRLKFSDLTGGTLYE